MASASPMLGHRPAVRARSTCSRNNGGNQPTRRVYASKCLKRGEGGCRYAGSMARNADASDLPEAEYSELEPLLRVPASPGRSRRYALREILDGIFHLVRSG